MKLKIYIRVESDYDYDSKGIRFDVSKTIHSQKDAIEFITKQCQNFEITNEAERVLKR